MLNKRIIWYLLCLSVVAALSLSACSSAPTAEETTQETTGETVEKSAAEPAEEPAAEPAAEVAAPSGEPVTLDYWLWQANQQPAYQACADAFTAENPNITIQISQLNWPDYWPNLQTAFASGTAPDVFTDHLAFYPTFASKDLLLDIQPLVERDNVDTGIYLPGLADLWVRDGKRYGLPKDWDTIAIVYNQDMLDAAGVTLDEVNTMTWNPEDGGTFEEVIAKLTLDSEGHNGLDPDFNKDDVVQYGYTFFSDTGNGTAYGQQQWSYLVVANGGKYIDELYGTQYYYNQPEFIEAIDWVSRMMNETHYAVPYSDIKSLGGSSLFQAGKVAMISDGSWMISFYGQDTFPTGYARLPEGPAGRKSMFNGLTDGIWSGTEHPGEAWEWVKFLASPECAKIFGEAGVAFPAQEEAVDIALSTMQEAGADVSAFTEQATEEDGTFLYPLTDNAPEISDIMNETMDAIFLGYVDAESGLTDANEQVNALFK
ncbi:MAG: sugar ABC transporter substrate-binding protein [Anaerolineae bacterium]|nr:sugar ABC transporter substrate-binding protein [Anaerolineae bacterium]